MQTTISKLAAFSLSGPAVEHTDNPAKNGYVMTSGGLPFNVHPEATPDEWEALQAAIAAGEVSIEPYSPPVMSPATKLAMLQGEARLQLTDSDITVMRCYERDIKLPPAWVDYRESLRELIRAEEWKDDMTLPEKPPAIEALR